ncbi:NADH-quinone oxidoreductase subunit NuoN [Altererythrobacter sp.]|uniref:NADH-quinone oxidoreductase subunit NuoN n=1 Tax=Altererythrobacter sp. TaxID=1872480 RepID=UPI001B1A462E|nr:NADH-quinone oxidoreductase subunit NuoN [Altererythrobacter sp.]MBO6608259.1 NADH-quinone oxidoreductase subunit NuoN [Altererythrobacter sp.]MBO6641485.1 NADH-quinone oxidoreductase subunit NuoN [Altererythrobacter sp.]MBO6707816.1 NADH-quinone oxidoreductase subunit NuoN [Altererythrobacter sp.]MBO6946052.1 NADH-quinone oxidoreductase subunit NuoN [Altererythrobacter sp.]
MDFSASFALIAPELVLTGTGMLLLLIAAWGGDARAQLNTYLASIGLFVAGILLVPTLHDGLVGAGTSAFGDLMRADAFSAFAKSLIYLGAIGCLLVAPSYFNRLNAMRAEYPVLIVFASLGMSIMVSAGDFLTLYLGLELNSLAAYVLASILRTDDKSAEAGLKYFVLGALASGILLYGMSLVYGFTGSTSFVGVSTALSGELSTGALFGIVFVLVGLAFKISAVPFHMWTPDVYEGAPTPVTTFFATAPKVAAVALTARVALGVFGSQSDAWQQIVIFIALASIVVGALGAIGQENIKRLLAFSSINNVGFILIGLAAATQQGASAMMVYLWIYMAMSLGSFVAVLMLKDADGTPVENISSMAGMVREQPLLAWCIFFLMLSLAGIPPLFGFWGKFVVFQAAVEADMIILAALGIAASVIGAFYYLKVCKIIMFDDPAGVVTGKSNASHWAVLGITTLIISPLGYLLTPSLGDLADKAASALFLAS